MNWELAPISGDPETDSLAERRWTVSSLTFSFPSSADQFTGYSGGEPTNNFEVLNPTQQAAVRAIFGSLSTFTNLTFTEYTGVNASSATLRFGMTDDTSTAHAYLPTDSELGGDSWYRNTGGEYDNPIRGNYAWLTFMHEIGHSLGLGHPHDSDPPMPLDHDYLQYTVMSYRSYYGATLNGYTTSSVGFPQSYMMEDIAALQFLYGANFNYNSGDTVYTWSTSTGEMSINGVGQGAPAGNAISLTIWDGGGIDTFDFSNYPAIAGSDLGVNVDLRPGQATKLNRQDPYLGTGSVGSIGPNIMNSYLYNNDTRSLIENAIGSPGNDVIRGNQADNVLSGGAGFDQLYGDAGNDTLHGGDGFDQLYGEAGNDAIYGGDGTDQILGDVGNDVLYGENGGDGLDGGAGDDSLYGGADNDSLYGRDGDDTLDAGTGDDYLYGEEGNDVLSGGDGNDNLEGGAGTDTLTGGAGNDALKGGAGNDIMTGGAGDDTYERDSVDDQITEYAGEGIDRVNSSIDYIAGPNIENIGVGGTGIYATGNALDNKIYAGGNDNIIDGGLGADQMRGGGGYDTYYVDNDNDQVFDLVNSGYDIVYSSANLTLAEVDPEFDPYAGASYVDPANGKVQIELVVLTGSANLNASGNAYGTTFQGNSGNNVIDAKGGNDTLIGGLGADQLIGGTGADVFLYNSQAESTAAQQDWLSDFEHGTDKIDLRAIALTGISLAVAPDNTYTIATISVDSAPDMAIKIAGVATDADFLYIEPGSETLIGTPGDDAIDGGSGNDVINGLDGNDILIGGVGNDFIDGGAGADDMRGGTGNDVFIVDNALDAVTEANGEGTDTIYTSVSFALGGSYVETLSARDVTLTTALALFGNGEANTLIGNNGANFLDGGGGIDVMRGFGGDDAYGVDNSADVVLEDAGGGNDTVYTTVDFSLGPTSFVETLSARDVTSTTALALFGSNSANTLIGNNGANFLDGGGGIDVMRGFGGDDVYCVDSRFDGVLEDAGGGTDTIYTTVSYTLSAASSIETLSARDVTLLSSINLIGNEFANTIVGNNGANYIDGGAGADVMRGFGGDDAYAVDNSADVVLEDAGGGTDTIYTTVDYVLPVGSSIETLSARDVTLTSSLALFGNELVNTLYGNNGGNFLDGGAGADVMRGFGGDDAYAVDNSGDQVIEDAGGGTDTVYASVSYALAATASVEVLSVRDVATTGAINLTGNDFTNTLIGNNGANVLDGRGGGDLLRGFGGADRFDFTTAPGGNNVDVILDMVSGTDKIGLDDAIFTAIGASLDAGEFVVGAAAGDADDRIIYNPATGNLYYDADGNGAGAAIQFAHLEGNPALAVTDFTVI